MKLTEQQKNCPYCHTSAGNNDSIDLIATNQEDSLAGDLIYIWKDRLRYETDTHNIARRIYYCPMCGRPLNEEDSNGKPIDAGFTSGD